VKGAVNGDFLLVPPPSATNVDANGGAVQRLFLGSVAARNSGSAATAAVTNAQIVYKAEGSREVVLGDLYINVFPGETGSFDISAGVFLAPTDRGIFLRVTGGVPGLLLDVQSQFFDTRGPVRSSLDVTSFDPAAPPAGGNPALAQTLVTQTEAGVVAMNAFLPINTITNFDSAPHSFHVYLTNGTDTIELTNTASPVSVSPGRADNLPVALMPALANGWSLKISLAVTGGPVATVAPRAHLGYVLTNATPARNDQAGAY
jgi:hypothetical protein